MVWKADYGVGLQKMGYVDYNRLVKTLRGLGLELVERFNHKCCKSAPNVIPMMVFQRRGVPLPKTTSETCGGPATV